jgi:hypothetical protein
MLHKQPFFERPGAEVVGSHFGLAIFWACKKWPREGDCTGQGIAAHKGRPKTASKGAQNGSYCSEMSVVM